jgi:hypothetical protein
LLVKKDYLVFLTKISSHAGLESIHELVASAHCDNEVVIDFFLQEQRTVMIGFV